MKAPKESSKKMKKLENYYYNPDHKLGSGTYGSVYSGYDPRTNSIIAVKQIPIVKLGPSLDLMSNQLRNEIKNMKAVSHKNIVKLLDLKKSSNNLYLIMEHCNSGHLENYLRINQGHLSESEALRIMGHIIMGYKCLNENKIVHRDIKPANILLHNDIPKLTDFGFSKAVEDSISDHNFNTKVGSPNYMSPQILDGRSYTCKTDVWSLGMMFYQMIFKKYPWVGRHQAELLKNIQNEPLTFPEGIIIQEKTKSVIISMLKENEEDRISWERLFEEELFMTHDREQEELVKQINDVEKSPLKGFPKAYNLNKLYFRFNRVVRSVFDSFRRKEFHDKNFNFAKELKTKINEKTKITLETTPSFKSADDPSEVFQRQEKEAFEIEVSQKLGRYFLQKRNKLVLYHRIALLIIKSMLIINEESTVEKANSQAVYIVIQILSYHLNYLNKLIEYMEIYEKQTLAEKYKKLHVNLTSKFKASGLHMYMESKYRGYIEEMLKLDRNAVTELYEELMNLIASKNFQIPEEKLLTLPENNDINWTAEVKKQLKLAMYSFCYNTLNIKGAEINISTECLITAILIKEVSMLKNRLNVKSVEEVDFFKYWECLERMTKEKLVERFKS